MSEANIREKIARIEEIVEQMDKRISEFREDFNNKLNHIEIEIRDLRNRVWWIIGIQITMWITIILTIIFK